MTDTPDTVTVARPELDTLLAVAALYLDAFTDDERMSFTEAWGYQDVQDIVDKYRATPAAAPSDPGRGE